MNDADLKKAGLKVTVPRTKILSLLEQSQQRHFSVEEIYKGLVEAGEEIGLATVYRVMTQFAAAGIVKRHQFEGEHWVFELNEGEHHDHIVCVDCGQVQEFFDPLIEARQEEMAQELGFILTEHSLNLYGICKNCQKAP